MILRKGLRAILRQDPDIVMVGEIRDTEAADIAVNAALTGHLVISTIHPIPRLVLFPLFGDERKTIFTRPGT